MLIIMSRNIRIFFRDKSAVFFSLLSVFIIVSLYLLFLANVLVDNLGEVTNGKVLIYSSMIAGITIITSLTATTSALGILVEDKTKDIEKDFKVAPIKRSSIVAGYILSSVIIGLIMCTIVVVIGEIFIFMIGGSLLSFVQIVNVLLIILLSVLFSSSFMFFIITFIKSQSAFSILSTITGVSVGFLTGMYLPIPQLPSFAQTICKLFPLTHTSSLLRRIFLETPMNNTFRLAPQLVSSFEENFTVKIVVFNHNVTTLTSVLYVLSLSLLFYLLSIILISKKKS